MTSPTAQTANQRLSLNMPSGQPGRAPVGQRPTNRASHSPAPAPLVPVLGSVRRIRALIALGHEATDLQHRLCVSPEVMAALTGTRGRAKGRRRMATLIPLSLHQAVCTLFDDLQMTPGSSAEAREFAVRRGWPLPLMWDEDQIDNPHAVPIKCRRRRPTGASQARSEDLRRKVLIEHRHGATNQQIADRLRITQRTVERKLSQSRRGPDVTAEWREAS